MVSISTPPGLIANLISEVLQGQHELHPFWATLAEKHQVLPVFGDFMGFWALSEDGRLMFIPDEEPDLIEPVQGIPPERLLIHAALAQAARHYPALAPYCPTRTAADRVCTQCNGSGRITGLDAILCECGGAGWVPADRA